MTDAEVIGSRRERCALAAAFLLSETTQDAAVAASALVALQLFGGYEESLFIVIVMTMLLIGIQLSHVVGTHASFRCVRRVLAARRPSTRPFVGVHVRRRRAWPQRPVLRGT